MSLSRLKTALKDYCEFRKSLDTFMRLRFDVVVTDESFLHAVEVLLAEFKSSRNFGARFHEKKYLNSLHVICSNVAYVHNYHPMAFIGYHRDKSAYPTNRADNPREAKKETLCALLEWLNDQKYIENVIAQQRYSKYKKRSMSKFRPTQSLREKLNLNVLPIIPIKILPDVAVIQLKDSNKKRLPIHDTPTIKKMRRFTVRLNMALANAKIALGGDLLPPQKLYRVFNNGSYKQGGRYYGGEFQLCEKGLRRTITIDGEPTVELDFSRLHITMAYHLEKGKPSGDPYAIEGYPAEITKKLINSAINATSRLAAIRGVLSGKDDGHEDKLMKSKTKSFIKISGRDFSYDNLKSLLSLIEQKHASVAKKYFFCGKGLKLQNLDSEIATKVMEYFLDRGEIVLPVHDSFIVKESNEKMLYKAMKESYKSIVIYGEIKIKTQRTTIRILPFKDE